MSDPIANPSEKRRSPRRDIQATIEVTDVIRDAPMGRLCDISRGGMMLMGTSKVTEQGLYQLRLPLATSTQPAQAIEVGVQAMWCRPAASDGQTWAGYRIVAISNDAARQLSSWLQTAA